MSEISPVTMPTAQPAGAVGGWRELLELNLGRRITAEFFPEKAGSVVKTGTLYAVQPEYFLLTDDYGNYVVSGFDSLRFVTFCPNCVPADGTVQPREVQQPPAEENDTHTEAAEAPQPQPAPRGSTTVSAAALNYARRKARRLD